MGSRRSSWLIFEEARLEGRDFLYEHEAKRLCSFYGMSVTRFMVSRTVEEAVAAAVEIGFPVVLKIVSPQVLHKSDAGGVLIDIGDEDGVRAGYKRIIENVRTKVPEAEIRGILVQDRSGCLRSVQPRHIVVHHHDVGLVDIGQADGLFSRFR